jgi:hypothetical protein
MPNFYSEITSRALEILQSGDGVDQLPFDDLIRAEHHNVNFNVRQALVRAQNEVEQRETGRRAVFSNKEYTKATNQITRELWRAGEPYRKRIGIRYYSVSNPEQEV